MGTESESPCWFACIPSLSPFLPLLLLLLAVLLSLDGEEGNLFNTVKVNSGELGAVGDDDSNVD